MTEPRVLSVVSSPDPAPYPIARSERLPELAFVKWYPQRWLFSRAHLKCTYEVQGIIRALFDISVGQSPIGTLPDDDEELAKLLRIDLTHWRTLRRLGDLGPLRGWHQFDCEGEVRFGHHVVIESLQDVLQRREQRHASQTAQAAGKRLVRLRDALAKLGLGADALADDVLIRRMDDWLEETWKGNRTAVIVARALDHAVRQGWCGRPRAV